MRRYTWILLAGLVLTGCSGGAEESPVVEVQVTASDYAFTLDRTEFAVGVRYRFVVTNTSVQPHEFVLTAPLAADGDHMLDSDGMDMGGMDHMEHSDALARISSADLPAGASRSVEVTFAAPVSAGALEVACHVAGHYDLGMHTAVVVQ